MQLVGLVINFQKNLKGEKSGYMPYIRKYFVVTVSSVIYITDFDEKLIVRSDSLVKPDGTTLAIPRTRLKLTDNAYPTNFENQPSYINVYLASRRKNPTEKKLEIKVEKTK